MHVTEPVRATIPVQNGGRLSWDRSIGRNIALWQNLWVEVGRFERRSSSARARRLRSAAVSINSGRHILESRCAEGCANDAFSTLFRATLNGFEIRNEITLSVAKKSRTLCSDSLKGANRALSDRRPKTK